ncbi:MAG: phosphoserine phosphatase SerB [Chitinophagaceae bacterium]|nr:phosphoserine phosphatase SerB [Oligoflexus sp.]
MTTFKLLVDSKHAKVFADLGSAARVDGPRLTRYVWEADEIAPDIRGRILRVTEGGHTAFYLPVREWKAAFFDMDSTVIAQESIVELAKAAGKENEVALITEQAMAGLLDFTSALRERVRMLSGLPDSVIAAVSKRLTINSGMTELGAFAKQKGIKLYLVSGGFNALASGIARTLGFEGFIANELDSENGVLTGNLRGTIINAESKALFLKETCARLNIHLNDTLTIGDGANDLLMMQASGAAIGYFPKKVLLPHLHGAIFHDHRDLIHVL